MGIRIETSIVLLCINLPVAIFCAKKISRRFVGFSLLQVLLLSLFMRVIPVYNIFDQVVLNVIFGGCIYGFSIALALRGGASTGGTDFIALFQTKQEKNCGCKFLFSTVFCWCFSDICLVGKMQDILLFFSTFPLI